jgi:hypothetical protein
MRFEKLLLIALSLLLLLVAMPRAQSGAPSACGLVPSQLQTQIQTLEPWYCPINNQIESQWVTVGLPLATIAVLISFVIAALIFMVGVAFNSERIRNFGMGEFYEAIATALIVGAFLYLCAIMFGIVPGIFVGTINPYATAFNLITSTISTSQQMYSAIFYEYMSLSYTTSWTITPKLGGAIGGVLGALAKNLISALPQLIINVYKIPVTIFYLDPALAIAKFISDGISILYAEYYLMVFFATASIPAFLVPGVVLRSIFPTRPIGGMLIALAFGFYLIMPTLFAVAFYFTTPTVQRDMSIATFQLTRFGNGPASQAISPLSPLVLQLNNVKSSLDGFWLLILFYPSLIIAITYTAVEQLASFIGSATARTGSLRKFI